MNTYPHIRDIFKSEEELASYALLPTLLKRFGVYSAAQLWERNPSLVEVVG
jgi:hypothetical protein